MEEKREDPQRGNERRGNAGGRYGEEEEEVMERL
ncbi:ABC drug exporter AtrF [Aspergillus luchuensis]|uniref:ABC drug exporter AtrF n=1 Tax=Aspergillus kawachii TaxID=1069201 RepID=A0A146FAK9_ASPKA|nr:ABC drug exporter AtrF [Aspergillus luchuensis]